MTPYLIAPEAQQDIDAILLWTTQTFGARFTCRYEDLLFQAISDVANAPERAGSISVAEIASNMRIYHLRHSRLRAAAPGERVKNPRHFLMYRWEADAPTKIIRVLHDRMEPSRHTEPRQDDPT